MDGWMGGWMGGWMDGWIDVKAGLRIAYSNQKVLHLKFLVSSYHVPINSNAAGICYFLKVTIKKVYFLNIFLSLCTDNQNL